MHKSSALLLSLTIVGTLLLAGCSGPAGLYDCGSDAACFQQKAQKCEPAKVTLTNSSTDATGSTTITVRMRAEVQSGTVSACKYYLIIDDMSATGTQQTLYNSIFAVFKGKDMTCTLPASSYNGPTPQVSDPNACTGSLVDALRQLAGNTSG